jgi:hypothetical protein
MRGTINYVCIYATNADARTHARKYVGVNRARRVGSPAMANLYLHPRISSRSRNLTAPLIFGIQVAYVAPTQDSRPIYVVVIRHNCTDISTPKVLNEKYTFSAQIARIVQSQ